MKRILFVASVLLSVSTVSVSADDASLRLATFRADATPPLGSPLCNGNVKPAMEIVSPLTARGVVLLGAGKPIAFDCALSTGWESEMEATMRSANRLLNRSKRLRIEWHCTRCISTTPPEATLPPRLCWPITDWGGGYSNPDFDAVVSGRVSAAAKQAIARAQTVTHIGLGAGRVEKVASNRRILGPDGRVRLQRQSSGGKNPAARAAPEGTIDPLVRLIAFWNRDTPVAVLTYYATHPQSYYGRGGVNWDFVGIAREAREKALAGLPHIHFDGAGGNIAAGKYNDGSEEKRPLLARRLAAGMKLAWQAQKKSPLAVKDVGWSVCASFPSSARHAG